MTPQQAVLSLVDWARVSFADRLVSVVVHGSPAWGCWAWEVGAWLRDGRLLSKRDGGRWLLAHDPRWTRTATAALDEYREPRGRSVDRAELHDLAGTLRREL
jgi:hypothetical protein